MLSCSTEMYGMPQPVEERGKMNPKWPIWTYNNHNIVT